MLLDKRTGDPKMKLSKNGKWLCEKCGVELILVYSQYSDFNPLQSVLTFHVYRCPKCGKIERC
jgi:uncharacterized protein with PIN domain